MPRYNLMYFAESLVLSPEMGDPFHRKPGMPQAGTGRREWRSADRSCLPPFLVPGVLWRRSVLPRVNKIP